MKKIISIILLLSLMLVPASASTNSLDLSKFKNDKYDIAYGGKGDPWYAIELSDPRSYSFVYTFKNSNEVVAIAPRIEYLTDQITCYCLQFWMLEGSEFQIEEMALIIDEMAYILPVKFSTEQSYDNQDTAEYGILPLGIDGMRMLSNLEQADEVILVFVGSKRDLGFALNKKTIDGLLIMFNDFSAAGGINILAGDFIDELAPIKIEQVE